MPALWCLCCGGPFDADGWCYDDNCRPPPGRWRQAAYPPQRRCVIRGCGRRTRRVEHLCDAHYAAVSDDVVEAWLTKIHPPANRLPEKAEAWAKARAAVKSPEEIV